MNVQRATASFVLRLAQDLWQDVHGDPCVAWRGQVSRVQDGEELRFCDLAEALTFIQHSLLSLTISCIPKENQSYQEKAVNESLKFWAKFAQSYTGLIVEALQQSMSQSEVYPTGVGEPAQPWWLAPPALPVNHRVNSTDAQEQLGQQLVAMQLQIERLTAKVSALEQVLAEQQPA